MERGGWQSGCDCRCELCLLKWQSPFYLVVMYMQERTCQTWTLGTVPGCAPTTALLGAETPAP